MTSCGKCALFSPRLLSGRTSIRRAHFEPIGGVSGNILLGAWLDAGLPLEPWLTRLRQLPLGPWELQQRRVNRAGVEAQWLDFSIEDTAEAWDFAWLREHTPQWALPPQVADDLQTMLGRLAPVSSQWPWSRAQVVDLSLDLLGFLFAREEMQVCLLSCGALPVSNPRAPIAHLLQGAPLRFLEAPREVTTLTGALLLTSLCQFQAPPLICERVGYGAGTDEFQFANVTRLWLGTASSVSSLFQLECQLDDVTGQQLAPQLELCLERGALDAWFTPVIMKKGRPGILLSLLCRAEDRARLQALLLEQLPTLGVRAWPVERQELARHIRQVETPWGPVQVKQATGRPARVEYEDAQRLAQQHAQPLWQMMRQLESWLDRGNP